MVDVVAIIVPIVIFVILLAVSFYLFAMYCHPEDKGIGTALPSKIIIIISQALAWGQLLLVPLDLGVSGSSAMQTVYSIVYILIFVFSVFIMPFISALYESDEEDSLLKRILYSAAYAFAITAVWCAVVFISFIWLSKYTTPSGAQGQTSAPFYMMQCMSIIGWILLSLNGGIGLVFLPYLLIKDFVNRPTKLTSQQAFQKKKQLQNKSDQLIGMGQKLRKQQKQYQQTQKEQGWFSKKRKQNSIKGSLEFFKKEVNSLEEEYQLFDKILNIKQQHPAVYIIKLIGGIFSGIISLLWVIILFGNTIHSNGKPVFSFMDSLLTSLSTGSVSFLATIIYGFLVLFLQACLIQGNIVFGIRIPFLVTFHPMKLNKTYLNSFLFNANMMMLASLATAQLSVVCFPVYVQNSFLAVFFTTQVINNQKLFGFIYGKRIFQGILLIIFLIGLIYAVYQTVKLCKTKSQKQKKFQQKKNKTLDSQRVQLQKTKTKGQKQV